MSEAFEDMLTGGHPNSLGRTVEVVEQLLAAPERFEELFRCYQSSDEVVRLRTSSAIKRVEKERHDLVVPYIDRLLKEIGALDQASAQWTLAHLFDCLREDMTTQQHASAQAIMQRNLVHHPDWIVLNNSMETLGKWSQSDNALRAWLIPQLERLSSETRKSVAGRAKKWLVKLTAGQG
ncbi:MAG: hypothetical protein AAFX04_05940 [Pseudomonadota bacterium]